PASRFHSALSCADVALAVNQSDMPSSWAMERRARMGQRPDGSAGVVVAVGAASDRVAMRHDVTRKFKWEWSLLFSRPTSPALEGADERVQEAGHRPGVRYRGRPVAGPVVPGGPVGCAVPEMRSGQHRGRVLPRRPEHGEGAGRADVAG